MTENLSTKLKLYGFTKFLNYAFLEIFRKFWYGLIKQSYSQNGEDLVIHKILSNKKNGFYVDVGANDPERFNNTKHFYLIGWHGINIEPNVKCFKKIINDRSRDINLNFGIANKRSKIVFYEFSFDTLSTFSKREANRYIKQGYSFKNKKRIRIQKLTDVFEKHLDGKEVDFLSIDTEGYDKEVILSNNWKKFRPKVVCVESVQHSIDGRVKASGAGLILEKFGYALYYNNGLNSIYFDNNGNK